MVCPRLFCISLHRTYCWAGTACLLYRDRVNKSIHHYICTEQENRQCEARGLNACMLFTGKEKQTKNIVY